MHWILNLGGGLLLWGTKLVKGEMSPYQKNYVVTTKYTVVNAGFTIVIIHN